MTRDQWLLTATWAAMAAVGALSIYKGSQTPKLDPDIARLCEDLTALEHTAGRYPPPADHLAFVNPICTFPMPLRPSLPGAPLFRTVAVGHGVDPTVIEAKVLPFPVMRSIQSDLDGTLVTWDTENRPAVLLRKMTQVAVDPSKFSIFRQHDEEPSEKMADLGPKARAWTDLSAKPGWTYRYWVTLTGLETVRSDRSGALMDVTNKSERSLTAAAPSATRIKLVGGDKTHGLFQVETYDRAKKAWTARAPVLAAPGEKVDGTGWVPRGFRFDGFTLVADMTDDEGAARVLSTKN